MAVVNDTSSSGTNMLLYVSIIGFAIISYVLYKFVLSPTQPADTQQRQQQQQRTAANTRTIRPSTSTTTSTASSTTAATKNNTDNDDYKFGQTRHPSHLLPPSNWSTNRVDLSGYLLKGIIPFRSTYANGYEVRLQQQQKMKNEQAGSSSDEVKDLVVVNRKERARIFARMFSSSSSATTAKSTSTPTKPPNRGSNIVITIHHTDVITNSVDSKLHKILYLLGTYYNVFVLVDASDVEPKIVKDTEVKEYIDKIRTQLYTNNNSSNNNSEYQLNKQIIPTHRIIVTTTSSGRVAFVRQLADTQLVIDYDKEGVVKELERFGFRTLCYPRVEGGGEGESSLGKFLIP